MRLEVRADEGGGSEHVADADKACTYADVGRVVRDEALHLLRVGRVERAHRDLRRRTAAPGRRLALDDVAGDRIGARAQGIARDLGVERVRQVRDLHLECIDARGEGRCAAPCPEDVVAHHACVRRARGIVEIGLTPRGRERVLVVGVVGLDRFYILLRIHQGGLAGRERGLAEDLGVLLLHRRECRLDLVEVVVDVVEPLLDFLLQCLDLLLCRPRCPGEDELEELLDPEADDLLARDLRCLLEDDAEGQRLLGGGSGNFIGGRRLGSGPGLEHPRCAASRHPMRQHAQRRRVLGLTSRGRDREHLRLGGSLAGHPQPDLVCPRLAELHLDRGASAARHARRTLRNPVPANQHLADDRCAAEALREVALDREDLG